MTSGFQPRFTDEQKRDIIAQVAERATQGGTQREALRAVADANGCAPRTIQMWAKELALPLPTPAALGAPVNAARASLTMTLQRQRDMAQTLLQVASVAVLHLRRQAQRGPKFVDLPALSRVAGTLKTLHELDHALMLQVGRFDASLSEDENARRASERIEGEIDEYAEQWRQDLARFGADAAPEPPPQEPEGEKESV